MKLFCFFLAVFIAGLRSATVVSNESKLAMSSLSIQDVVYMYRGHQMPVTIPYNF